MNLIYPILLSLLFSIWVSERAAFGMFPNILTDRELADQEVIVVAYWPKGKFENHDKIVPAYWDEREKVCEKSESHTMLKIERVIKGDIKPGLQPMMIVFGIGWKKDGKYLCSATSTLIHGAVKDVTRPAIWFLKRSKSWKTNDSTVYLEPENFQTVQPLNLEPFYRALLSENPSESVKALLQSSDKEIVLHAQDFLKPEKLQIQLTYSRLTRNWPKPVKE